ncbi:YutD family protein [Alkalibacillus haloalkaliphilus]|uniref:YutD family protein n=1 Tax=Alkalibacillus haloalkaliphilus TaxID=94136 RepID=UPI0003064B60|nr:YutD family protein [Alkalibacillus haloalkaliphilus]
MELQGQTYELIYNYRDGFQEEVLEERFTDILTKYDYIVGDWGFGQLRLKGFYDDHNQKATYDTKISTLEDYLYEYCNFGCAYFVLKRVEQ